MKRSAILRTAPSAVGTAWAAALCAKLAHEGRSVEGGWPGTLIEARALITSHLRVELDGRDMRQPSTEELVAAAAATYERARAAWLAIERRTRTPARPRA